METTLSDIHPHIIQTHILPRLDPLSLSTAASTSSYLKSLCAYHNLWSNISKSTWPSISHPRVDQLISTFPAAHRSFFQDAFPSLITGANSKPDSSPHDYELPSELISAVDLYYQNESIYSTVEFTDTTTSFLNAAIRVELNDDQTGTGIGISRSVDLKVDELTGADEATLTYLKESVTLNWIIIDPVHKRAGNLSSVKPVSARQDWTTHEPILQYVVVLPGCDTDETVTCRIHVVFGVGKGGVGLHVRKVILTLHDMDYRGLNGKDFLVITQRAIMEENNVRRKVVVDDNERWLSYNVFKEMKREKMKQIKMKEEKKEFAIIANYIGIFVSLFFSIYLYNNL